MSDFQTKPAVLAAQDTTDQTFQVRRDATAETYVKNANTYPDFDDAFKAGADWAYAQGRAEIEEWKNKATLNRHGRAELVQQIERLKAELEQWRATTASRTQELQEIASAMNAANNWREQALKLKEALETIERAYPTSGERMAHQDFAAKALREFNAFTKEQGE